MSTGQSLIQYGSLASRPAAGPGVIWGTLYFTTDTGAVYWYNGSAATWLQIGLYPPSVAFAGLPGSPVRGMLYVVTDATTNTWGANITAGSGGDTVLAFFDGVNWTVAAK